MIQNYVFIFLVFKFLIDILLALLLLLIQNSAVINGIE